MDVIILAGGLGTRLRSVVSDVPKCMAQICDKPFLYYLLKYLTKYEINKVILSLGYKHKIIIDWINSQIFPFPITYSIEDEPLGTGGAIKKAMEFIQSDEVLIMNGDTFFEVNISSLLDSHKKFHSQLTITLKPMKDFDRYGNVEFENDIITSFKEKAYCKEGLINGGVYLLNKKNDFMVRLPDKFSLETDVLKPQALTKGIFGFVQDNYFIDIGIPLDYHKANKDFKTIFI